MLLPALAGAKEKARRAVCMGQGLKQLCLIVQLYGSDNQEAVLPGRIISKLDGTDADNHVVRFPIESWNLVVAYGSAANLALDPNAVGGDPNAAKTAQFRIVDCPNLYPMYQNRDDAGFDGILLGYNYLGNRKVVSNWDDRWFSPNKLTDIPNATAREQGQIPIWTEMNQWATGTSFGTGVFAPTLGPWVTVAHRKNGGIRDMNATMGAYGLIRPNNSKNSMQWGSQGGNVGYLDGSVIWKKIEKMGGWDGNINGTGTGYAAVGNWSCRSVW